MNGRYGSVDDFSTVLESLIAVAEWDDQAWFALNPEVFDMDEEVSEFSDEEFNNLIAALLEQFPDWDGFMDDLEEDPQALAETPFGVRLLAKLGPSEQPIFLISGHG